LEPTPVTYPLSLHDALPIYLGAGEAEHVAQDQHRALARRQVLERRHERQLHALALLVAGLGRGVAVCDRVVWIGLDPHRLHERRDRKSTRLNSSHVKISYAV